MMYNIPVRPVKGGGRLMGGGASPQGSIGQIANARGRFPTARGRWSLTVAKQAARSFPHRLIRSYGMKNTAGENNSGQTSKNLNYTT